MSPKLNNERSITNELRINEAKEEKNIFCVSATYSKAEQNLKTSDNNIHIQNDKFDLTL